MYARGGNGGVVGTLRAQKFSDFYFFVGRDLFCLLHYDSFLALNKTLPTIPQVTILRLAAASSRLL